MSNVSRLLLDFALHAASRKFWREFPSACGHVTHVTNALLIACCSYVGESEDILSGMVVFQIIFNAMIINTQFVSQHAAEIQITQVQLLARWQAAVHRLFK